MPAGPVTTIVVRLTDLLRATGTAALQELADLADGDCDADLWLDETDDGIEVGAGVGSIGLVYPFPVAEFWSTVDEVDRDEVRRWEAEEELT